MIKTEKIGEQAECFVSIMSSLSNLFSAIEKEQTTIHETHIMNPALHFLEIASCYKGLIHYKLRNIVNILLFEIFVKKLRIF